MFKSLYLFRAGEKDVQVHDGQAVQPVRARPGEWCDGQLFKHLRPRQDRHELLLLLSLGRLHHGEVRSLPQDRDFQELQDTERV